MTTRTRQVIAGVVLVGGVIGALAAPFVLGLPVWVALVTVVVAIAVLGPLADRIRYG